MAAMMAREIAKGFVWAYVVRGTTVDEMASGFMGAWNREYQLQIGGGFVFNGHGFEDANRQRVGPRQIAVRPAGADQWSIFDLPALWREIQREHAGEPVQAVLL